MENCFSINDFLGLLQISPGDVISLNGQVALGLIGKKIITGEDLYPQNVFTNTRAAGIIWGVKISSDINIPGSPTHITIILETSIGKLNIPCVCYDKKTFRHSGWRGRITGTFRNKIGTQIAILKN